MKIGDRIFVRGYIDEIRKDTVIVRNDGGYFGTIPSEVITGELPSAQPELKELSEWKADFKGFINALDMPKDDYNGIMEYIDEMPSAQPEQRWVPLGRPMKSGTYLVTLRQKFEGEEAYGVRIMRFINGNWMLPKHFPEWINEEIEQEVLAWMPLPAPYWKEGEADG